MTRSIHVDTRAVPEKNVTIAADVLNILFYINLYTYPFSFLLPAFLFGWLVYIFIAFGESVCAFLYLYSTSILLVKEDSRFKLRPNSVTYTSERNGILWIFINLCNFG